MHFLKLMLLIGVIGVIIESNSLQVDESFRWVFVNFTWPSSIEYNYYTKLRKYVAAENIPSKIKIYKNKMYIALGRFYSGTPVTLGYVSMFATKGNPLITPFPSWDMNVQCDCSTLQNVNSIEIEPDGTLWVLDGLRHNNLTPCPAKLLLYNLTRNKLIKTYEFPNSDGVYYADFAIDTKNAYIADSSAFDPGIVIYSRSKNKSWKVRDSSMYPDPGALNFIVGNRKKPYYHGVSAIAVSPNSMRKQRYLFYSPLSSYLIYKVNVDVLRSEPALNDNTWRSNLHAAGKKVDQSYAYGMNNNGDMYFCLVNKNALAKWRIDDSFSKARILTSRPTLTWCSGFAFDDNLMYILVNNFGSLLIDGNAKPNITSYEYRFRIYTVKI